MTKINTRKQLIPFRDVVKFAAGYWFRQPKKWGIALAMLLSAALLETYLPRALSTFLTAIGQNSDHATVLHYLSIFVGVYFAQTILFSFAYMLYNNFETLLFKQLVDDIFAHIYLLPEKFFANTFTGSIVSKINRARTKIEVFEDQILVRIFPTFVVLVGSLFFLSMLFPLLATLLLFYFIFMIIASAWMVFKFSGPAQGSYAQAQDEFNAHLADSISGIAPTKSYAQEEYEYQNFTKITSKLRIRNLHAYYRGNLTGLLQRILLTGMLAIMMGGGTWYYFQGKATVESMAYLAFAYTIMQSYIRDVAENIKNLLTSAYDLHGAIQLTREIPEENPLQIKSKLNISHGKIEFNEVTFTYPEKLTPIFQNLSVTIKAGERIALVGHSGGGKTSFIRLLQSLYPIQQGRILVDDQDIATATRQSLRSAIALVPQDPILFHRTLKENIAYARPDATFAEIQEAAKKAHIEEFILTLPQQYETLVGERGIKLSGGERQRIAIARAILADRPILILDEATSSLDSESERAIQDGLHTLTHGRTSIMIAHRLSTILDADRILVFESGSIVEQGSHEELIGQENGIYANLFKLQSGGFIAE